MSTFQTETEEFKFKSKSFVKRFKRATCLKQNCSKEVQSPCPDETEKTNRPKKFEQFQLRSIVETYRNLSYNDVGCWSIFYDIDNVNLAWEKLKALYSTGNLPGVTKICRGNFSDPQSLANGVPISAFCGPCRDKEHCLKVGKNLVSKMEHKKQECNGTYPKFIYFKRSKKGNLFENGPSFYRVRYF
jgi:hypothetical protein